MKWQNYLQIFLNVKGLKMTFYYGVSPKSHPLAYMYCTNFRYFDTKTKINVILL